MAYKIYQKLKSGMANQGLLDAVDVDVMENGQRVTLAEKLSGLSEDVAGMAEDVSDAVEVADGIKTAQGQEVGDVAETDIAEGVLIWHGGKLYRVLSLIAAGDRWQDMDVAETTVSEEINAMRGVSTEGVYLTITPASAIPAGGVKARIYNEASQTYLPEVTFTSASNSHLLGQIAYGDVYTIIMPSIDGYTQPADQTFKAGQMLRQRTVEYIDASVSNVEVVTCLVAFSSGSLSGDYSVVIKQYDNNNTIVSTTTLPIGANNRTEPISIPIGTKYSVTFPDIPGYLKPTNFQGTARVSERTIRTYYVAVSNSSYRWVTTDFEYYEISQDITDILSQNKLLGVAYVSSDLLNNNAAFIYVIGTVAPSYTSWTSVAFDIPSAISAYDGQANSASALDAIAAYEQENSTTVNSIFKISDGRTPVGGKHFFVAADNQFATWESSINYLNNILTQYGSSLRMSLQNTPSNVNYWFSRQTSVTQAYRKTYGSTNKTVTVCHLPILPLITTQSD